MILITRFNELFGSFGTLRTNVHRGCGQRQEVSWQHDQMGNQDLEVQRDRVECCCDVGRQADCEQNDQNLSKSPCWR